ncbi:MAG: hypothetical protein C0594_03930, partial [Marinilabiliales bacterium]
SSLNIYLGRTFSDSLTFDDTIIYSSGFEDVFIAKYNPSGIFEWVRSFGDYSWDHALDIATDQSHIYLTGYISDSAQIGDTILLGGLVEDFPAKAYYLVAFDQDGSIDWVRSGGGTTMAISNGFIYTFVRYDAYFTSVYYYYLWRYDSTGVGGNIGSFSVEDSGGIWVDYITVDDYGSIYMAVEHIGYVEFGGEGYSSNRRMSVVKYDSNWVYQWRYTMHNTGYDYDLYYPHIYDIQQVDSSRIAIFGSFYYNINFPDTNTILMDQGWTPYTLLLDTSGTYLTSSIINSDNIYHHRCKYSEGDLYMAGTFDNHFSLYDTSFTMNGTNCFMAKMNYNLNTTDYFNPTPDTTIISTKSVNINSCDPNFDIPIDSGGVFSFINTDSNSFVATWHIYQGDSVYSYTTSHLIEESGTHRLELVVYCSDGVVSVIDYVDFLILGTHHKKSNMVLIYPNPVHSFLFISNNTPDWKYQLYDVNGKLLLSESVNKELESLDLSGLKSGLYLLKIWDEYKTETKRIIVGN